MAPCSKRTLWRSTTARRLITLCERARCFLAAVTRLPSHYDGSQAICCMGPPATLAIHRSLLVAQPEEGPRQSRPGLVTSLLALILSVLSVILLTPADHRDARLPQAPKTPKK